LGDRGAEACRAQFRLLPLREIGSFGRARTVLELRTVDVLDPGVPLPRFSSPHPVQQHAAGGGFDEGPLGLAAIFAERLVDLVKGFLREILRLVVGSEIPEEPVYAPVVAAVQRLELRIAASAACPNDHRPLTFPQNAYRI